MSLIDCCCCSGKKSSSHRLCAFIKSTNSTAGNEVITAIETFPFFSKALPCCIPHILRLFSPLDIYAITFWKLLLNQGVTWPSDQFACAEILFISYVSLQIFTLVGSFIFFFSLKETGGFCYWATFSFDKCNGFKQVSGMFLTGQFIYTFYNTGSLSFKSIEIFLPICQKN